jgi:PAS domain S-box-containing protein
MTGAPQLSEAAVPSGDGVRERLRAEDALRQGTTSFELALRCSGIGVFDLAMPDGNVGNGRVVLTNVWEQLGYAPPWPPDFAAAADLLHPDDKDPANELFGSYLSGETPHLELEYRVRHYDGSYRTMMIRGVAIRDSAGKATRLIGTCVDITERKRIEAALREGEERLRLAADVLAGFVYDTDLSTGRVQSVGGVERVLGFKPGEVPADFAWWQSRVHPEDLSRTEQAWRAALESDVPGYVLEYRVRHREGHYVDVMDRGHIVRDAVGRAVRAVGGSTDVSERRRLRRERDEVLVRLRLQFDRMPIACILFDPQRRVLEWNPAAESTFGYRRDEVVGRDGFTVLLPPALRPEMQEIVDRLASGDMGAHAVNENVTKDGRRIICEWHNTPLCDAGGDVIAFLSTAQDITERVRAEEALQQVTTRLELALRGSDIGIFEFELPDDTLESGRVVFTNVWEQLGYPPPESPDFASAIALLHPDDEGPQPEAFRAYLSGETKQLEFEYRLRHSDGSYRAMLVRGVAIRDGAGKPTRVIGSRVDVTARKRAEEALREKEERLAADLAAMERLQEVSRRLVPAGDATPLLAEIVDAAIAVTAADMGNIQLLNDAGELEIVASRGFYRPFLDFFHTVHDGQAACGSAMQQGARVVIEDVRTSPVFVGTPALDVLLDAGVLAVESTPLVARSGRLVGMLSTHYRTPRRPAPRDLHLLDLLAREAADWIERTHAEEALRESEKRYRSLISQVKDFAIFSTDERGVVATWNEGCQYVLGYAEGEFVGLQSAELFTAEDRGAGVPDAKLRHAAAAGTARTNRWMVGKDGRRFFAMGATASLKDSAGRLIGFSTVLRDVTQMKLSQDELVHHGENLERLVSERTDQLARTTECLRVSERMASLGTLSAGLGHDMGNLLLPLSVRLELLLRADLPAELHEHVLGIQTCAQYLQRLSNGLRLLAVDPSHARTNDATELGAWWSDVTMMLKGAIPRGVQFDHCMAAAESWVAMGRVGLTQAVFNLVQNAADALRERGFGRVTIAVDDDPDVGWVVLCVTDDGPGMTDEVLRRCMEPYFTTKARGVSTGMGLAFVRGLVTEAGGRVEIDSMLGRGTTISLVLPRARVEDQVRDVAPPVAVVDMADARMRSFISGELRALGFDVRRIVADDAAPTVIVVDPDRVEKLAGFPRARDQHLVVVGELPTTVGGFVAGDVVALGPDPPPEAIVQALRDAARKIDAIGAP